MRGATEPWHKACQAGQRAPSGVACRAATKGRSLLQLAARAAAPQYMHIPDSERCNWLRARIETAERQEYSQEEKLRILDRCAPSPRWTRLRIWTGLFPALWAAVGREAAHPGGAAVCSNAPRLQRRQREKISQRDVLCLLGAWATGARPALRRAALSATAWDMLRQAAHLGQPSWWHGREAVWRPTLGQDAGWHRACSSCTACASEPTLFCRRPPARRLTWSEMFESFLANKYTAAKR